MFDVKLPGNIQRPFSIDDARIWGPGKWNELHKRPFLPLLRLDIEKVWIDLWVESIPCGKCKAHFQALRLSKPEVLTSREAYHQWTIDVHNLVNVRLNKPQFKSEVIQRNSY